MPTYNFHNTKTDEKWTEYMSISEMEKFTKKKHIKLLMPTQLNIVSSVGNIDVKLIVVGKKFYQKYLKHTQQVV